MSFNYIRRKSHEVKVGHTAIGGDNPIRVQSMCNTNTLDTPACVTQSLRIAEAGGEIVRLTTQGVREASNMAAIKAGLDEIGCDVPLVADVHFNPNAAYEAATTCDKVRINPGNFTDGDNIRKALVPFIDLCKQHNTAVRLGVNHGSLSPRIMEMYGDTPEGMVESALEYLRIFEEEDFHDVVISIKASNVVVMVQTVRLLADRMAKEGMHYPLHLGVTEAGDGEDGRVKSAAGIGCLLAEGLGDTIRVSLSEPPENEIPVAITLRNYITAREMHPKIVEPEDVSATPTRDLAQHRGIFGQTQYPLLEGHDFNPATGGNIVKIDASEEIRMVADDEVIDITSHHINPVGEISSWLERYYAAGGKAPAIIRLHYGDSSASDVIIKASADFGALLLNGYGNAIAIDAPILTKDETTSFGLGILQAVRLRISKTEYIACPSCGRTLFDLPATLAQVKEATKHLVGLKIGVMGCIVNGPGEMADADYGYVGAGPGRVSLYKGKLLIRKNIPTEEALPALLEIINHDTRLKSDI